MIPNLCPFELEINFSRIINLLLTKLARDRTGKISALGLFCTDLAALGPYCQDLGPIFSQYGPRAWLMRCIYYLYNNQINARALIGQSAMGYFAGKPTEKPRVF